MTIFFYKKINIKVKINIKISAISEEYLVGIFIILKKYLCLILGNYVEIVTILRLK